MPLGTVAVHYLPIVISHFSICTTPTIESHLKISGGKALLLIINTPTKLLCVPPGKRSDRLIQSSVVH